MPGLRLSAVISCLMFILPPILLAEEEARSLSVEGIEVTQAIQSLDQDVLLVAGKPTVARIYLSLKGPGPVVIKGRLTGARGSSSPVIDSINTIRFSIVDNLTLQQKRSSEARSLNFLLPESWIMEGTLKLSVATLQEDNGSALACSNCSEKTIEVVFDKDAPLRVRLLGIRYRFGDPEGMIAPTDKDFALTESWLRRAYPVAQVISSRLSTDANSPWPFDCNAVNAQISALRALDISGGVDPRTHYYGIVSDNNTKNFMRGCASGIPSNAEPATVASGPAGTSDFGWDPDGSYADWYTAHELGHTFGRKHPGFCNGNSKDDNSYPFPDGSISDGDKYVGLDLGDTDKGIRMQALGGSDWHDVMTYCDRQWVSRYTYLGIRQRLLAEDNLSTRGGASLSTPNLPPDSPGTPSSRGRGLSSAAEPAPEEFDDSTSARAEVQEEGTAQLGQDLPATPEPHQQVGQIEEGTFVSVVATINLTRKSGKILYVNPVSRGVLSTTGSVASPATLRLREASENKIDIPVVIRFDTDRNQEGDQTGLIDALIPLSTEVRSMELLLDGDLVDSRSFGPSAPQVTRLQIDTKEDESRSGFSLFRRGNTGQTVLLWDGTDEDGDRVTYSVQRSSDLGKTWETLAVGLRKPELELDQDPRESEVGIMFRIIANDGMNSTYTTTSKPIQKMNG